MAILCNATRFEVQCRMAAPGRTHVPTEGTENINL
jgi:hypothetical protein